MEHEGCKPPEEIAAFDTEPRTAVSEAWKEAIDRVVPCVVVLKITQTRAIDTEAASSSYATGFVVDKARGLILTNRHVCTPGPIVAEAVFHNHEEVTVRCIYRDPVHDFGFLMFDPSKLQFMALGEIPLAPDVASVGMEIRVIGNDSGEKISILGGTIARLDRDAPTYGKKAYNDFNQFYFQAASGTKGGSSGSPVIDVQGRAVGLNAGGKTKAASAFYLPLDRVVRVLKILQENKAPSSSWSDWNMPRVPRGDLQTTFCFRGFDEVRRLGLTQAMEAQVRLAPVRSHGIPSEAQVTGMLVVESVIPGSPADKQLEAGDVLLRVQGVTVTHFLQLEEILDDYVNQTIAVEVQRGGKEHCVSLCVTDLETITPSCFLEVSGGILNQLSYQQARNNNAAISGVYVAEPGYMLGRANVPKHAIITALSGQPTPDLESLARVLGTLPHGARAPVEFFVFTNRHRRKNTLMFVDRQWYGPPLLWVRNDSLGKWISTADFPKGAPPPPEPLPIHAAATTAAPANEGDEAAADGDPSGGGSTPAASKPSAASTPKRTPKGADKAAKQLAALEEHLRCCMCLIEVEVPLVCLADGVIGRRFAGTGVIVYQGENVGLVLLDRNTVAIGPCDINISFGAHPAEVSARTRFLHPLHNFSLVSYNPRELPPEARCLIRPAQLSPSPLQRGESVTLACITKELRVMQRKSNVTNATFSLSVQEAEVPRFRAVHEEVIKLDQDFGAAFSGILTDDFGALKALYGSYSEQEDKVEREWCVGLPTSLFAPWVRRVARLLDCEEAGPPPSVRVLNAELEPLVLSKAAQYKLPAEWVTRLTRVDPERRQVLRVRNVVAGSLAADVLRSGDMILAVNGSPVTCFGDVEAVLSGDAAIVPVGDDALVVESGKEAGISSPPGSKRRKMTSTSSSAVGDADPASSGKGGRGRKGLAVSSPASAVSKSPGPPASPKHGEVADPNPMSLTVFRSSDQEVMEIKLRPGVEDGMGTGRIVHFCGAQIQAPHRAVREHGFLPEGCCVFISRWHHGSPAHRYGFYAMNFVAEVNGISTPDMDAFVNVIRPLEDGTYARIKMYQMDTMAPKVITVKLDLTYWPTWELVLDPVSCKWIRKDISCPLA